MAVTIGNIIITVFVLIILIPLFATIESEWGTHQSAQAYASNANFSSNSINRSIYTPITKVIANGTARSNNLNNASAIIGFALAFILPGMGQILSALIQIPNLLGSWISNAEKPLTLFLPQVANNNLLPTINSIILDLLILFVSFIFFSLWQKYPSWGATG